MLSSTNPRSSLKLRLMLLALVGVPVHAYAPSLSRRRAGATPVALRMAPAEMAVKKTLQWVPWARLAECRPNTVVAGTQKGLDIAIATTPKGERFAISNKLPPTGQPAVAGTIDKSTNGPVLVEELSGTSYR